MEKISLYLKSQSRNKIVIHKNQLEDITSIDIGKTLAKSIPTIIDDKRLSMKAAMIIDELFNSLIVNHEVYGKVLGISNLGILFEPQLKIDFTNLIERFSNENSLFIHWEGDIEKDYLYFLTKEKGKKIILKNLSHIII